MSDYVVAPKDATNWCRGARGGQTSFWRRYDFAGLAFFGGNSFL